MVKQGYYFYYKNGGEATLIILHQCIGCKAEEEKVPLPFPYNGLLMTYSCYSSGSELGDI